MYKTKFLMHGTETRVKFAFYAYNIRGITALYLNYKGYYVCDHIQNYANHHHYFGAPHPLLRLSLYFFRRIHVNIT